MRNAVVYKVTWKHMKMNKRRTCITFLGIFLMVLLLTCVFSGRETAVNYLQNVGSQVKGKWHVSMYNMTENELKKIEELGYVKETGRSVDYGFTRFSASENPERPYLFVKSYEAPLFDWMNITLKEGRLPEKKGEIVISQKAIEEGAKVSVGDTFEAEYFERTVTGIQEGVTSIFPFSSLKLEYGETKKVSQEFPFYEENNSFRVDKSYTGKREELTVAGIIESPVFEQEGAAGYMAFTCYDEKWDGSVNVMGIMDLKSVKGDLYEDFRKIAGDREVELNNYVLSFSGDSSDSVVNFITQVMTVFFLAVIVTAAIILIYNVFNISFEERSRYLGMLCSVGATGRQKRSSVYFEAFSLFLPALPLGILAGLLMIFLGMHLLLPFIYSLTSVWAVLPERLPVHLVISWKILLFITIGSGLTVFLSALLPAVKISRIGPVECIRGNLEKGGEALRRRKKNYLNTSAEKMLADNSLKYQRRKTRGMVRAAALFMIILTVVLSSGQLVTKLIYYRMVDTNTINIEHDGWDYFVTEYGGNLEKYREMKKEIMSDTGVKKVCEEYTGMFIGNIPKKVLSREYQKALHRVYNLYYHRELSEEEFREMSGEGTAVMNFIAVDEEIFEEIAEASDTDIELLKDTDIPPAIVVQSGEVSTENWRVYGMEAEKYEFYEIGQMTDLKKGESIPLTVYSPDEDRQVEFPLCIAGYADNEQLEGYFSFHSETLWVIISLETGSQIEEIMRNHGNPEDSYGLEHTLYLHMNGKDTGLLSKLGMLAEEENSGLILGEVKASETLPKAINSIILILLICFILLTSIICLLNLYNSIHGWIVEQKVYFAMLVSVGMTQRQIRRMLLYEAGYILARSCIWTVFIGTPLILGVKKCLINRFGYVQADFPWGIYLMAAVLDVIAIFGFMLYHYTREKNYDLRTVFMV